MAGLADVAAPPVQIHAHGVGPDELLEERDSLRDRCAALEARNIRLLDEVALLRSRVEVDIPHWVQVLRAWSSELDGAVAPFAGAPLGEKLGAIGEGFQSVAAGLQSLGGAPLREELAELKKAYAELAASSAEREQELRSENVELKGKLHVAGLQTDHKASLGGKDIVSRGDPCNPQTEDDPEKLRSGIPSIA